MLKMNKLLLFLLIMIISSFTVSGIVQDDANNVLYYSLDNLDLSGSDPLDLTPNNYDGTNTGVTTGSVGILNEAFTFSASNIQSSVPFSQVSTHNLWVKKDSVSNYAFFDYTTANSNNDRFVLQSDNRKLSVFTRGASGENFYRLSTDNILDGNWHMVTAVVSTTANTIDIYVDGNLSNGALTGVSVSQIDVSGNLFIGSSTTGTIPYDGLMDEVSIWNKSLSSDEILYLYNLGAPTDQQQYPFAGEDVNESLESTIFGVQNGSQLINSPGYVTVLSASFNVSKNNTKSYLSVTNMVSSTTSAIADCRITLNGVDYNSSATRNILSGSTGNMYFTTDEINLLNETNYDAVFQCKRNTGGSFTVSNTVGVGHLLVNQADEDVPYKFKTFSGVLNDDSAFTLIDSYFFDVNNITGNSGDVQQLVLDWSASYENTGGSDQLHNMYFEVVGYKNCSNVPRTVLAGTTGSVGGNCLISPVNVSANVTINVYAKGLTSDFTGKVHIKNFLTGSDESNSLQINASNNFNNSFQLAFSMLVNNTNHDTANMFFKNSLSVSSNVSTFCEGYSILRDGGFTQTGNTVGRSVDSNIGVINFQWVFNDASKDNYSLDTYIKCDDKASLSFIGEPIIYMTDSFDIPKNSFTITLKDNFDNGSIGGFNVTLDDGSIFSFEGTSGEVFVDIDLNYTNLTITTDYLGGYFPVTILNHNVSNSLSLSINQSIVSWNCIEKVSGNDLNCTSPLESDVFNYNTLGNPYIQSVNVSGYFERFNSFNIIALFNGTKISDMYTSNLSVNVNSEFGDPVSCDYNVSNLNNSFTEIFSGSPNSSVGLINGSYNVTVDCLGFALQTLNVTINESFQSLNFTLFTTNSVFLRFFDTSTGVSLNGTNVTVIFIGATSQTNISSTGDLFVDLLNPSEYTILFSADNYRQGSYIFRVVDNRNVEIDLFMEKVNDTELVLISVIEKYSKDPIQGALVTIQKYKDNGWVTDQIVSTDFQGFTEAYFVISTEFYNFVVEFEGQTFFGVINSNENKKTIFAEDVTNGISIEIDTSPENTVPTYQQSYDVVVDVRYNNATNTSGFFIFEFDDTNNIPRNVVLNVTQDGVVVCSNSAFSESGNINCAISVTLGEVELFTGTGYILFGDEWIAVDVSTNWVGIDPTVSFDWESTGLGYIMSFFIVLIAFLLFAKIPSMSMLSGTLAFISLIVFRVLFNGINLGLLTGFLFAAYLLSRIPSKSGVNA